MISTTYPIHFLYIINCIEGNKTIFILEEMRYRVCLYSLYSKTLKELKETEVYLSWQFNILVCLYYRPHSMFLTGNRDGVVKSTSVANIAKRFNQPRDF